MRFFNKQTNGSINIQGNNNIVSAGDCSIASGAGTIAGNGDVLSRNRDIACFSQILVNGAIDVIYTSGSDSSLTLSADSNLHDLIATDVVDGCLIISSQGSYSTQCNLQIQCSSEKLEKLIVAGSADAELSGIDTDSLSIEITGSGDVEATGKARVVNVQVKGCGHIDLSELQAKSGFLGVRGSGDIRAVITESVSASIKGSGDIKIEGNPTNRSVQKNGFGNVKFK
jgi:hypothetical protein